MGAQQVAERSLATLVASLADNKYFLGRRYAEWCTAAPTLESAVAAAAMAQDEIGHARSLYPLLEDVAGKSPEHEPETRTQFLNAEFLGHPFGGWTDFVAANFIFDTAMTVLLDAARSSSFGPLAQRARRIHEEEPLHWLHAEGWVRRLSTQGDGVRNALRASCAEVWPQAHAWLTVGTEDLVSAGILSAGVGELRQQLKDRLEPVLAVTGTTSR